MKTNEEITIRSYVPSGVQLRKNDDGTDSRVIEGYAIVFNQRSVPLWRDAQGKDCVEVVSPDAVTRELLDGSDILMTAHHDSQYILARSKKGQGTLSYEIDEKGVRFSFPAPNTEHGNEMIELVRRGDIDGCSFAFTTRYSDSEWVECSLDGDKRVYTVRKMGSIYDFTLTPTPAYPQTECKARSVALAESESIETEDGAWRAARTALDNILNQIFF